MSTPPRLSFISLTPDDFAFDDDFRRGPPATYLYNGYHSNLQMSTPVTQNHQPCLPQCSMPENISSFSDTQRPWHINQVYDNPGMLASAYVAHTQMATTTELWDPSDVQLAAEVSPTSCLPTAVNEGHSNHMMSACYPAYGPGQNVTYWDGYTAFDPSGTFWSTLPDRRPMFPLVDQKNRHHSLDQSCADSSHACSSHATYSRYPSLSNEKSVTEPLASIPYLSQSFSPTSPHFGPHPTLTRLPETNFRSHLGCHRIPYRNSRLSRRKRDACAIEYNGLRIDKEELFKGLMEPDGKFTVHPCRWEEDHSPCGLWIRGDKSYISAHIQKWHGGMPGGDKFQADCRWSACGKTMAKESITRHIVSVHLGEVWECQGCGKAIVRSDAYRQHALRSNFAACRTSVALITYSADTLEIDARAALEKGGRLPYTSA